MNDPDGVKSRGLKTLADMAALDKAFDAKGMHVRQPKYPHPDSPEARAIRAAYDDYVEGYGE